MPFEGRHSEWLIAFRQCQNAAASEIIDELSLKQGLCAVSKHLASHSMPEKLKQNLTNLLEFLLCNTDLNWIACQLEERIASSMTPLFEVFMKSPADCCLLALSSSFNKQSTGARQSLCLRILELYFKSGKFVSLLLDESSCSTPTLYMQTVSLNLVAMLNSLPDKIANKTMGKFSAMFHHKHFFRLLAIQTAETLEELVNNIRAEKNISVHFLSVMIGQFCFNGKSGAFLGVLLPLLVAKMEGDFLWRRLWSKIMSTIPERCLEPVISYIVNHLPWYGCMGWMFGNAVLERRKVKFILLHKLLLVKHFPDANALRNIIGYIADRDGEKTERLVVETLKKLLAVWADSSAIKHTSYEQHKYVTQAILICTSHLTEQQCMQHGQDLTLALMPGMSSHLDCSDASVRRLGMVVGEALTAKVDVKSKNKLEFEYTKDAEAATLLQLLKPMPQPDEQYFQSLLEHFSTIKAEILKIICDDGTNSDAVRTFATSKATYLRVVSDNASDKRDDEMKDKNNGGTLGDALSGDREDSGSSEELDSDDEEDDLQPYDMSNDTVHAKVKKPMYIRDCMEGLLQNDDRDRMEICLSSAKYLIEADATAAKEVSVEMCKILLNLDDTFALPNFTAYRRTSMVALTVSDPKNVAEYLTTEFYGENYSLQHRLDMLDVLTAAASVLSSVEKREGTLKGTNSAALIKEHQPLDAAESWREIVDKRIESKTRRFGKVRKKAPIPTKPNEFGPVAGCFFYPLMAGYDRRIRTLDLLGTDSLVLGRLLYSVGTIVYSAMNTMAASAMARSLIEFVLEFRYHSEAFVRQAALFCVSMAVISAGNSLLEDDAMGEVQQWLGDVMARDPSTRTKELAEQTAVVLSTSFSKKLGAGK